MSASADAAAQAAAQAQAQTACAKEAIQFINQIQDQGLLLALTRDQVCVAQVSENAARLCGRPAQALVGKPFAALFQSAPPSHAEAQGATLPAALSFFRMCHNHEVLWLGRRHVNAQGIVIWELEPFDEEAGTSSQALLTHAKLQASVKALQAAGNLPAQLQTLAEQVQRHTDLDRVLVYRFDREWNGEVVAQALVRGDSYLGQHFPASDIPPQARAVFLSNTLRTIADAQRPPAGLVPAHHPQLDGALDMGLTQLRQPSPIHIEYLQNMGASASVTLSLRDRGRLWGLVACHHMQPKKLCPAATEACQTLAQVASALLALKQEQEDSAYGKHLQAVNGHLQAQMQQQDSTAKGLTHYRPNLLDAVPAAGVAGVLGEGGRWVVLGKVPTMAQILELVEWLKREHAGKDRVATDRLPADYPPAKAFAKVASGLLAIALPRAETSYLLWFRTEVVTEVQWAGNPNKAVERDAHGAFVIHPRSSFELWRQKLTGRSAPWREADLWAALQLRELIIEQEVRRQYRREKEARAETERERRRFSFLSEASVQLSTTLKAGQIESALGQLSLQAGAEVAAIWRCNGEGCWQPTQLFCRDAEHLAELRAAYGERQNPLMGQSTATALQGGCSVLHPYLTVAAPFGGSAAGLRPRSYLAVALRDRQGRFIGCLEWLTTSLARTFNAKDIELAAQLSLRAATALENAWLFERAQAALRAREEMVAIVSHDLKNPLTAIGLDAQVSARAIARGAGERAAAATARILETGERMRRLIDELLSLSRLEGGQFMVDKAPLSLRRLLQQSADQLNPLAASKGGCVKVEMAPSVEPMVLGEWDRLLQVLSNLGGNAIKFSPPQGTVTLGLQVTRGEAIVQVHDEGPGISAADLPKIFQRFWQAKKTAKQGSGIGLAIAKGFVEAHRGRIWAESRPGEGTTVKFALPLA